MSGYGKQVGCAFSVLLENGKSPSTKFDENPRQVVESSSRVRIKSTNNGNDPGTVIRWMIFAVRARNNFLISLRRKIVPSRASQPVR